MFKKKSKSSQQCEKRVDNTIALPNIKGNLKAMKIGIMLSQNRFVKHWNQRAPKYTNTHTYTCGLTCKETAVQNHEELTKLA